MKKQIGYISPTEFGELAGAWRKRRLHLIKVIEILNKRKINRGRINDLYYRTKGTRKKLALTLLTFHHRDIYLIYL